MEFHFVKLNVNGSFLTLVDPSSKPRYLCFAEKHVAEKCVDYVSIFRSKHGIWPSFDMSQQQRKLKSETGVRLRTVDQVKKYLEINSYDFQTLDSIANRTNISFYCVLRFDSIITNESETVNMSGQEMDGHADPGKYAEWMDFNLKIK